MNATILVDWPLFRSNPYTQDFIAQREGQARMVLLVPNPETDDFDWPTPASLHPLGNATDFFYPRPEIAWDAVIRNSGGLDVVTFKKTALNVIQDASTMEPVIALDANSEVNAMYKQGGVLITVEDL